MTFPVPASTEGEGKEARSQEDILPSAEQLHVGSVQLSHCQLEGDRFTLGNITGFHGSAGIKQPSLGRRQGKSMGKGGS